MSEPDIRTRWAEIMARAEEVERAAWKDRMLAWVYDVGRAVSARIARWLGRPPRTPEEP